MKSMIIFGRVCSLHKKGLRPTTTVLYGKSCAGNMRRMAFIKHIAVMLLSISFVGCATVAVPPNSTRRQNLSSDTVVEGSYKMATIYDLKRLVAEIMDKMKTDNVFMDALSNMKEGKGMQPDLVVALVDNKSGDEGIREMCRPTRSFMSEWLYGSRLFSLKNDDNSLVLAPRILSDITGGDKDANKRITPDSLDLYLCTQLENTPQRGTDGVNWYAINITLHDLHTGRVLWTGNRDFYKNKAK